MPPLLGARLGLESTGMGGWGPRGGLGSEMGLGKWYLRRTCRRSLWSPLFPLLLALPRLLPRMVWTRPMALEVIKSADRVRRTWLERLLGYRRMFETEITDGEQVMLGATTASSISRRHSAGCRPTYRPSAETQTT